MDRGARRATAHGVTKSRTQLSTHARRSEDSQHLDRLSASENSGSDQRGDEMKIQISSERKQRPQAPNTFLAA